MIRGTFIDDRPYTFCWVTAPAVGVRASQPEVSAEIPLLVDTGSDLTVLSRRDCEDLLGISIELLPLGRRSGGIGGVTFTRSLRGIVRLRHEDGLLSVFSLDLTVPESGLGTSLLGRDIMAFGELAINFPRGIVSLDLPKVAS